MKIAPAEGRLQEEELNKAVPRWWKSILVFAFVVLAIAEVFLVVRQQRTQALASRTLRTAAQLVEFAQDRSKLMQRGPNESFEEYQQRIADVDAQTESLYSQKYYSQVARIRDGLAHHGLRDSEVDEFYRRPPYPLAIREIGEKLFRMGAALRSWTYF